MPLAPAVVILPDSVTVTLPEPLLVWVVVTDPFTVTSAAKAGIVLNPPNANKPTIICLMCG